MDNKTIQLDLTVEEVNVVLAGLGKLPAEASYNLITKIKNDAEKWIQARPQEFAPQEEVPAAE